MKSTNAASPRRRPTRPRSGCKYYTEIKRPRPDGTTEIHRYFRRRGYPLTRLHHHPGTPEFERELALAGAPNPPTRRQLRGTVWVYFIQEGGTGAVKIGSSLNPTKRLSAFNTAWPYPAVLLGVIKEPFGGSLERTLHRRFRHLRIKGEWYKGDPELMAWIAKSAGPLNPG